MKSIAWRAATAFALGLATIGCGDSPGASNPTQPIEQSPTGLLQIKVETMGDDPDRDGYQLSINRQSRGHIGPSGTAAIRLPTGTYELGLELVNGNCAVQGQHPRLVTVAPNVTLDVTFSIVCEVVGYAVVTRTSGADLPIDLRMQTDGQTGQFLGPNDSIVIVRQRPGARSILITGQPQNCKVVSANPVSVELVPKSIAVARFQLSCARTEKRIAFVANGWIATVDAQGSFLTVFREAYDPTWSPDGSRIAFVDGFCYLGCWSEGIGILDVETRERTLIPNTEEATQPAWSPDGNRIAFVEGKNLFTMLLDGSDRRVLTDGSLRDVQNPTWSPDGTRLVFDCGIIPTSFELCVINIDGSGMKRLTENVFHDGNAAWSPDGLLIAFETNRFGSERDIAIMKADGSNVTKVAPGYAPSWTPDGARILFTGSQGIFTVRTDGTELTRLTTGWHYGPAWRP